MRSIEVSQKTKNPIKDYAKGKVILLVLFIAILTSLCCNKTPNGNFVEGKVALTFDDSSIHNWHAYLPFFDSLNIKATFYVSFYHALTKKQKEELHAIAAHGHEIGYHTTNHPDLVKMLKQKNLKYIIEEEINKDLSLMRQDGFQVRNFAYPYGSHNSDLDFALLKRFNSIRALCTSRNLYKSFVNETGDRQLIHGADIDINCKVSDNAISGLLQDAQSHHDCLVLLAHKIDKPDDKFSITTERIRMIGKEAQKRNLKFVTVSEVVF
jgi:peptidoglycan/xylan/chitin deacetylase (PgdA/CDA1 family)